MLRLSREKDDPLLRDALDGLLTRLDLSWLEIDPQTDKILKVILVFVESLQKVSHEAAKKRDQDEKAAKNSITQLIRGKPKNVVIINDRGLILFDPQLFFD